MRPFTRRMINQPRYVPDIMPEKLTLQRIADVWRMIKPAKDIEEIRKTIEIIDGSIFSKVLSDKIQKINDLYCPDCYKMYVVSTTKGQFSIIKYGNLWKMNYLFIDIFYTDDDFITEEMAEDDENLAIKKFKKTVRIQLDLLAEFIKADDIQSFIDC